MFSEHLSVVIPPSLMAKIDRIRERDPDRPNRSTVVRELIAKGLKLEEQELAAEA
jgi:metal-responsive CopG/Arc/MetJ family transcriptional regulator